MNVKSNDVEEKRRMRHEKAWRNGLSKMGEIRANSQKFSIVNIADTIPSASTFELETTVVVAHALTN